MEEKVLVRALVAERMQLLGYIQSIVRDPHLSEDVFQDVCVLAVHKRSAIMDESHLMKWLRTSARLCSLNAVRKARQRHLSLDDGLLELLDCEWDKQDTQDTAAWSQALRHCMELLSPSARELLTKRYMQGIGYPSLAKSLNRDVKSLYVTFSRIYTSLADCITQQVALSGEYHE